MTDNIEMYKITAKEVSELLTNNSEWEGRYKSYVGRLNQADKVSKLAASQFGRCKNLAVYLSISRATKISTSKVCFDLRYRGQSVADLIVNLQKKLISLRLAKTNAASFLGYPETLKNNTSEIPWRSDLASRFRTFFAGSSSFNAGIKRNAEHDMESQWLTQLSLRTSANKMLMGIQPVKLLGQRFQMPTPLTACKAKDGAVKYSAYSGGGIDVLARHGKGKGVRLTVIELKDENKSSEPPEKAIRQAIAYAAFVRLLLRSKKTDASAWWKLFGFKGEIPAKLIIQAVIAMPSGKHNDTSFAMQRIAFDDPNDSLELHYIYFDVGKEEKVTGVKETSLRPVK